MTSLATTPSGYARGHPRGRNPLGVAAAPGQTGGVESVHHMDGEHGALRALILSGPVRRRVAAHDPAAGSDDGERRGAIGAGRRTPGQSHHAANEALIKLLAQQLHCPRNRVDIVRGHTSRHEVIKLYGLTPKAVLTSLAVPTSS